MILKKPSSKSQSTLEYAILIIIVVLALTLMSVYIRRSIYANLLLTQKQVNYAMNDNGSSDIPAPTTAPPTTNPPTTEPPITNPPTTTPPPGPPPGSINIGGIPSNVYNGGIPANGENHYYFVLPQTSIQSVAVYMLTADWATNQDLIISTVRQPSCSDITQPYENGPTFWYGPTGSSNETSGIHSSLPAGTIIYITVCNRSSISGQFKLYWGEY